MIKLGLGRGQWRDWEGSSSGFLKGQPCVHRAVWLGWSQGIGDRQPRDFLGQYRQTQVLTGENRLTVPGIVPDLPGTEFGVDLSKRPALGLFFFFFKLTILTELKELVSGSESRMG